MFVPAFVLCAYYVGIKPRPPTKCELWNFSRAYQYMLTWLNGISGYDYYVEVGVTNVNVCVYRALVN